jgi:dienelactone hydrolase
MTFIRSQPFVRKDAAVIVGHSAGGWGALALARHNPKDISAIVAFAPGRGGHANDRLGEVCAPDKLIEAARSFGAGAKVPVTWLVAQNDSYFPPDFSRRMADAFRAGGDKVDFRVLPPFGSEGHWVAESGDQASLGSMFDSMPAIGVSSVAEKAGSRRTGR